MVPPRPANATPLPFAPGRPAFRCLRAYSIDPSLTLQLETAPISEVTFKIPWEELSPGPVGEYLEVIDVDPASGCYYEPVQLDDPKLLAQDGLAPSEGTPQFHQQMVYAVASLTIRNFERALGRRSLWRHGPAPKGKNDRNDSTFVQRLRIYPHALREENAYYSPAKMALLFGYFKATNTDANDHVPGGMVFTCLSHDIVAHETTHALARRNAPAVPEPRPTRTCWPFTRRSRISWRCCSTSRSRTSCATRLRRRVVTSDRSRVCSVSWRDSSDGRPGCAARCAMRSARSMVRPGRWTPRKPDPSAYQAVMEPHDRGAILVAAVFDAFLHIYERRTADLLRLATGGSGVLQPGAIHPDLVVRLADEARRARSTC